MGGTRGGWDEDVGIIGTVGYTGEIHTINFWLTVFCIETNFVLCCFAEVKSVECHLHALMCSVSDHPPSCE